MREILSLICLRHQNVRAMFKIVKGSLIIFLPLQAIICFTLSQTDVPYIRTKRSGMIDAFAVPVEMLKEFKLNLTPIYSIYRKRVTWKHAHEICETYEGRLATFVAKAYADLVVNAIFNISIFSEDYDWGRYYSEFGLDRRYWIGLSDLGSPGKWIWVGTGEPLTYSKMWYPGQPDHVWFNGTIRSGRAQHCVSLWNPVYFLVNEQNKPYKRHKFDDLECDRELYFICEFDSDQMKAREDALKGNG